MRTVGEEQVGALLLVERLAHLLGRSESVLGQRLMPGEDLVFGDQDIGMSIPRQVDELEIRVVPGQVGQRREGGELIPALVLGALEEAGRGPAELDQVELPVAGQVQELLLVAAQRRRRGDAGHQLQRPELALAQARLVEPGIGLLGQDAGNALPVEVDPLVT